MNAYMWWEGVMQWLLGALLLWVALMLVCCHWQARKQHKRDEAFRAAMSGSVRYEGLNGEFIDAPDNDTRKVRRGKQK